MKGTVRRAPGGGWIADVTIAGRRKTAKLPTKPEAVARLRELNELLQDQGAGGGKRPFTLSQARELSLKVRWSGKAYKRTAAIYSQAALDWFGDVQLDQLDAQAVDAWRDELARQGNRPATINRKCSALRSMLADAHLRGHLAVMPSMPQQLPSNNTRDRVFSAEEEQAFCRAFIQLGRPAAADLFVFLLYSAARFSEAAKLRGEDVDIDRSGPMPRGTVLFRDTKNGTPRKVPIPLRAVEAIEPHLPAVKTHHIWQISYWSFRDLFDRAKALLGLREDQALTIHSTRHTCASRLASGTREKAPVPLHVLRAYGGWRSLAAVQRYAHCSTQALDVCVSVLEG